MKFMNLLFAFSIISTQLYAQIPEHSEIRELRRTYRDDVSNRDNFKEKMNDCARDYSSEVVSKFRDAKLKVLNDRYMYRKSQISSECRERHDVVGPLSPRLNFFQVLTLEMCEITNDYKKWLKWHKYLSSSEEIYLRTVAVARNLKELSMDHFCYMDPMAGRHSEGIEIYLEREFDSNYILQNLSPNDRQLIIEYPFPY